MIFIRDSAARGFYELDELEYSLDLINRHKREMRDAIETALKDDEVKRRLQIAIDNIHYFCQEVGRIHRQQGKL